MKIILIIACVLFLLAAIFLTPFCYTFISSLVKVRKIEKKINELDIKYDIFVVREKWAKKHKIDFNEPFTLIYENNSVNAKTSLSQSRYLEILKESENEIDSLLANTHEVLKDEFPLKRYIAKFNQIKYGIYEANPYK